MKIKLFVGLQFQAHLEGRAGVCGYKHKKTNVPTSTKILMKTIEMEITKIISLRLGLYSIYQIGLLLQGGFI